MSTPSFRTVVFFGEQNIQVFRSEKGQWEPVAGTFSLDAVSPDLVSMGENGNVLAVVSDAFAGHVQIALPNKKEQLAEEHLGQVLRDEYQIDLSAYEFASQRFAVGRQFVQVSVSGIEREVYQRIAQWCWQLAPKKVWLMPFGWFVSVLKSVEPALLAVVENAETIHVSHHYLGVDDARQISLEQLAAYAQSRKDERKETHLMYVQSPKKLMGKIDKALNAIVAVHPLLPDADGEPLIEVIQAVMEKGAETLHELLHFEPSQDVAPVIAEVLADEPAAPEESAPSAPEQMAELEEKLAHQAPPKSAEELPRPKLPLAPVAPLPLPASPVLPKAEEVVGDEVVGETAQLENTELEAPTSERGSSPMPVVSEPVTDVSALEPEDTPVVPPEREDVEDTREKPAETQSSSLEESGDELGFLAQLQVNRVSGGNSDRYVTVKQTGHWKTAIMVFLIVFTVTAIVGGAIFWSQQVQPSQQALIPADLPASPSPSPTLTPSPEPVASPAATLAREKKAELTVVIYNATGINGLAGKVKAKLEAAGWQDVKTGNATGSYSDAVFASSKIEGAITQLTEDLGSEVKSVDSLSEANVSKYDVVIVLAENPLE